MEKWKSARQRYIDEHQLAFGSEPSVEQLQFLRTEFDRQLRHSAVGIPEPKPDYSLAINPIAGYDSDDFLVDQLIRPRSNTGLIAPTNSGGSTLLLNVVHSLLTNAPLFGIFEVRTDPEATHVVWVNPEEAPATPRHRLISMGVPDRIVADRFTEFFVRDARLFFNDSVHVEQAIEALSPRVEGAGFVVVVIDGATGTVRGNLWNEDFEAWKDGLGQLKTALGCDTVLARDQVTGSAARAAIRSGSRVSLEDAKGAQFAEWPDQRFTYSYGRSGQTVDKSVRTLEVRGRLVREQTLTLEYNEASGSLKAVGLHKTVLAHIEVQQLPTDDAFWAAVLQGEVDPSSKRSIAEYLSLRTKTTNRPDSISESVFQRALRDFDVACLIAPPESLRQGSVRHP